MALVGHSNLKRAPKYVPYLMSNVFQNLKPYISDMYFQIEMFTSILQGNFVKEVIENTWKKIEDFIYSHWLNPIHSPQSLS